jgi:hypothetical protein
MNIQIDITKQDFAAFCRFVARSKIRAHWLARWITAVAVATGIGLALYWSGLVIHGPSFVAGFMAVILWFMIISRIQVFRIGPADDGFILGKRSIEVVEAGIRVTAELHESLYRWSAVRNIGVTDQHLFVMVDSSAGIIVPLRAFSSESEREQFVGVIRAKSIRMTTS